jgi:hypothetical protein
MVNLFAVVLNNLIKTWGAWGAEKVYETLADEYENQAQVIRQ